MNIYTQQQKTARMENLKKFVAHTSVLLTSKENATVPDTVVGQRYPSQRTLLRLEQLEVNAGLRKPPGDKQGILRLLESIPISRQSIGESEHDAGVVEVPVEYRRGSTPKNLPEKVSV